MKSFSQFLAEMPQAYGNKVTYQKDTRFIPISVENIKSYTVLGHAEGLVFLVDQQKTTGFVFSEEEMKDAHRITPVMRVSLRDSKVNHYKQAFHLRIRESFARKNITLTWYLLYAEHSGGVVSDFEHLEGGKLLWKSLIKAATHDPKLKMSLLDSKTGESKPVDDKTPESEIWSSDDSKKHMAIVLEKK